jgi:hypothetical protein
MLYFLCKFWLSRVTQYCSMLKVFCQPLGVQGTVMLEFPEFKSWWLVAVKERMREVSMCKRRIFHQVNVFIHCFCTRYCTLICVTQGHLQLSII